MRIVIADAGPINYLILMERIDLLPKLFEAVLLPAAVRAESAEPDAPAVVRTWIARPPAWLEIRDDPPPSDSSVAGTAG